VPADGHREGSQSRRPRDRRIASRWAAVSCIPGITCPYVARVKATVLCPMRPETTFGCSPLASISVAMLCAGRGSAPAGGPACSRTR
jgi:hypothetical protein